MTKRSVVLFGVLILMVILSSAILGSFTTQAEVSLAPKAQITPRNLFLPLVMRMIELHNHWGETWNGPGNGLTLNSTDTGGLTNGLKAQSASSEGNGVYGIASSTAGFAYGALGHSESSDGVGVYGYAAAGSGNADGVYGKSESTSGTGISGWAAAASGSTQGVYGVSDSPNGTGVLGFAPSNTGMNIGVHGQSASTDGTGVFGWATASSGVTIGVLGQSDSPSGYGVFYVGGLAGTGTKSAIVDTESYGWRHLYAIESPGNWFEDFGSAQLTQGEALVAIEAIYAETVNLAEEYHVFLTPLGDCALYVSSKTESEFTVRAMGGLPCNTAFDYRIVARRLSYEDSRLEPASDLQLEPPSAPAATDLILEAPSASQRKPSPAEK